MNKISIIGAGAVGSTAAYALSMSKFISEMVIVDLDKNRAEGEALDLNHGAAFINPMKIVAGSYEDTKDSDIVIITAGAAQKVGETRIDLVNKNINIFKSIIPEVTKYNKDAILLVVSNPVDILTYVTYKLSGYPKERVIGSGTVLDSSRLKYELSKELEVAASSIQAHIIGEHGDTEFPAWSSSRVEGINLDEYAKSIGRELSDDDKMVIHEAVKNGAYEVINRKGATYYAIGLSIKRIVEAILYDENSILPVSSYIENYYGVNDIYMGLPTLLNREGAKKVIKLDLSLDEEKKFKHSAECLKEVISSSYEG